MDVTSTVTSVNAGFTSAGNTVLQFINGNISTILIVFGIVFGVFLLMRIFRRAGGR